MVYITIGKIIMEKTILIIEDEPSLQKTLASALTDAGYEILQAFDGESGLEITKQKKPDLVLLDLVLPKKHGLEVLKAIKEHNETSQIPVIVITNVEDPENIMKAMELGAKAYLLKTTYSIHDILEKIASILQQ